MDRLTRREFLRCVMTGAGALVAGEALYACGPGEGDAGLVEKTSGVTPTSQTASSPSQTPSPEPSATAPATLPDLAVARGGEPRELVRQAVAALGGIQRFVRPGDQVIVKPNICAAYHPYEYAVTTNPWVVGAVVELCLGAGAGRVRVMDYPFGGTAEAAYQTSGIQEQVVAAGGEMDLMQSFKYVRVALAEAVSLHEAEVYEDALTTDVLINVPIAKHHGLTRLTIGMKNLMGLILGREAIHLDFAARLPDLAGLFRPALTIVDAVRILTDNGPTGGDLADVLRLDTVIAGTDIVAADSYAATLFGLQPEDLSYVRTAAERGLGRSDLAQLRIQEIAIDG